jgi:hypothetical protein
MLEKVQSKKVENLQNFLFESFVKSLLKQGEITLDDFNDKEKLNKKLLKLNDKADFKIVIDHKTDLLETARYFLKQKEYNKSKLFYATYFEHEINGLIIELCEKKKIEKKTINDIIKSVTIIGKFTWLPLILGATKVSEVHKNIILRTADERNAYVHYKYNPGEDENENEEKESKIIKEFQRIESTITYIKKYKSRNIFNGNKTRIENLIRKPNKKL